MAAGVVVVAGIAETAAADTKLECSQAFDDTQVLRDAGNIDAALREAEICTRAVCAQFIRDDCSKWKADLESRLSSVILEVFDGAGGRVTDATVSLDGVAWVDPLDGHAHVLSKGTHALEIRLTDGAFWKNSITIQEGEKERRITIRIGSDPSGARPDPAAPPSAGVGPWVLGGVGVATLIGGVVTGALVISDYGVVQDECSDATQTCTQTGRDAAQRGQVLGPLTTGLLVGGAAIVAGGVIWLVVAGRSDAPSTASVWVAPAVAIGKSGLWVGGRW